jgi:hypothetical protein
MFKGEIEKINKLKNDLKNNLSKPKLTCQNHYSDHKTEITSYKAN